MDAVLEVGRVASGGLDRLVELAALDRYLAVCVTRDADAAPQVSVVNFGVVDDPETGEPRVGFVSRRGAKLANLRRRPHATLVVKAGWEWISVSGPVTLAGPDDPHPALDAEGLRLLLQRIFHAAGGQHDDLRTYDEAMATERRCAVLLTPEHLVTNSAGSEHREPSS
jgi:PPOX class probable F420-dependent enzyme